MWRGGRGCKKNGFPVETEKPHPTDLERLQPVPLVGFVAEIQELHNADEDIGVMVRNDTPQ